MGGDLTVTGVTTWAAPSTSATVQNSSITGAGSFLANGGFNLAITLYNDTLTLDVPLVIGGASSWSDNTNGTTTISGLGNITNNNTINAVNPGPIVIAVPFTNNATLSKIGGGGHLNFNNTFDNTVTTGVVNVNNSLI